MERKTDNRGGCAITLGAILTSLLLISQSDLRIFIYDLIVNIIAEIASKKLISLVNMSNPLIQFILITLLLIFLCIPITTIILKVIYKFKPKLYKSIILPVIAFLISLLFSYFPVKAIAQRYFSSLDNKVTNEDVRNYENTPVPIETQEIELKVCQDNKVELPCLDEVLEKNPRHTLFEMAVTNYHVSGEKISIYAKLICDANIDFLAEQFYTKVPKADQIYWGNNPCNFLIPGTFLVIPIPPEIFKIPNE